MTRSSIFPDEVVRLNIMEGMSLLRAWREYKKLTQVEVAARAGISQPALAQMERNKTNPRKDTLRKLAKALGVEIEQLMV